MASPQSDPLSCDELTLDWDTGAAVGAASAFPGRGGSPVPRLRDDDSDGETGSASEDEDEQPDDAYWRSKMAGQAALAPEADYPDWHPAVGAADRVALVEWIGRVRGRHGARGPLRGPPGCALTRGGVVFFRPATSKACG